MKHIYCQLVGKGIKGAASVGKTSINELMWDICLGKSVADQWPKDVTFQMRADRPKDKNLIDSVSNRERIVLASPALQDFFKSKDLPGLEFLPVTILDHKGNIAADNYVIVQCYHIVDCIDQEKSKFKWDDEDKTTMTPRKLVFDQNKLSDQNRFFRVKYIVSAYYIREDLVEEMRDANFLGPAFSREIFGDYDYS